MFWASGNRLLPYGNRLPESKNSGKRFSLKNSFGQIVLFNLFFEKFFLTYLDAFVDVLAYLGLANLLW